MSPVTRTTRFGGDAGALQTLHRMRDYVNLALSSPVLLDAAHEIVSGLPPRAQLAHASAIRLFMVDHLRFIPDPVGVEIIETPESMIKTIRARGFTMGDCDNAATLSAALCKAVGIRCRFVILGFTAHDAPFQHVYTEAVMFGGVVEMDVTRPQDRPRPTITRRFVLEV